METIASFGIVGAVIALIAVWYLGGAINSILSGAGEIASKEFDVMKDKQRLRIATDNDKLGRKAKELLSKEDLVTKSELRKVLHELDKLNDEHELS